MAHTKSISELALKRPNQFLSEHVFKNLYVDEFKFGPGSSGKLGLNMISHYVVLPAKTKEGSLKPVTKKELAIHLNCIVKASGFQGDVITIHVQLLHLTVRSLATQKKIDSNGASEDTAGLSIHMNVNTGWGQRDANLKELAKEVDVHDDEKLTFEVERKQGYNGAYMRCLVKMFREKVRLRIQQLLGGNVEVKWEGDKTFPAE